MENKAQSTICIAQVKFPIKPCLHQYKNLFLNMEVMMQGLEHAGAIRFRRVFAEADEVDWPCPEDHDVTHACSTLAGSPAGEEAVAVCDGLIDLIAVLFSVSGRHLRSPKRHGRAIARVRQIGMYIAHTTLGMRMVDVATGFGRNKSTVMYACHLVEDMRDDLEFNQIVARVEQIVRAAFHLGTSRDVGNGR
ncbi:helix-turn-helix domain-containing protein [Oceaniradius stylonematis]|uniref:helix-turn-helix domain-containing protein n=1 Tax=Oceaniradius stylonematis TaxID=2184161 RepID=UPI003C7DC9DF